jgi:hypothetical protein
MGSADIQHVLSDTVTLTASSLLTGRGGGGRLSGGTTVQAGGMTDEELLPIGRFARLSGLTIHALRHYDEVGPRWLDLPIDEIRQVLADPSGTPARAVLADHANTPTTPTTPRSSSASTASPASS